ncbi:hypothetical protein [Kocuria turfanensis]|uniref:Uncharacterized protein n=1 Tax=Kocuria turfanensis TaxID=388357 RepID=A0A512IFE6_9MICC|nr:hypothetical protein [Kocuria turfanensis]GEO96426.1 hypothetical protein KTU01_25490 [Kocuria turfanensis]
MSTTPKSQSSFIHLAVGGFVILHVLCCGLPLLIAAGVLSGVGGVGLAAGNVWWAAGAGLLAVGLVVWFIRRRRAGTGGDGADCCAPDRHPLPRGEHGQEALDRAPAGAGAEAGK